MRSALLGQLWKAHAPGAPEWKAALGGLQAESPSRRYHVAMTGSLRYRDDLIRRLGGGAGDESSDATLVAAGWERWRDGILPALEGEFSLAVFDAADRAVTIAQSVFEGTPLYYVDTPAFFAFATRIDPLLDLPGVERALDAVGLARALCQYEIQAADLGQTCFRGVRRLPVACALRVSAAGQELREYWAPSADPSAAAASEKDAHHEIRDRLRASVAERVRGQSRVACLLSGGLDSSSVAALAVDVLGGPERIVAFSSVLPIGSLDGEAPDERPFIELMRRHLDVEVRDVTPPQEPGPWRFPDAFFDACEAPVASPRHYLYQALFSAAANASPVVLDGAYGELGPSGYAPPTIRERVWRRVRKAGSSTDERTGLPHATWLLSGLREDFLHQTGLTALMSSPAGPLREAPAATRDGRIGFPIHWRKLARGWIGIVAGELDVEYPFRDRRLWQYCAGLPQKFTRRDGYNRHLLRAAMAGILPESIRLRTTKGAFSPDYLTRMRRGLGWARTLCDGVHADEAAGRIVDLEWMRSALRRLERTPTADALSTSMVFLLQSTAMAIQYLRWFEARDGST